MLKAIIALEHQYVPSYLDSLKVTQFLQCKQQLTLCSFSEWIPDASLDRNNLPDIFQVFMVFPVALYIKFCSTFPHHSS